MIKENFISRSPIRNFETALDGGLKSGEVGVVTSKKGVGKTSMLVQLGIDQLLQGKSVVHISFSQQVDYTLSWYSDLFDEMAKKKNLERAEEIKTEIIANRIILNFNQDSVHVSQIIKTIKALTEGGSTVSIVLIDDFEFDGANPDSMAQMKAFAEETGVSVWYTAHKDVRTRVISETLTPHIDGIDVVLYLEPFADAIHIYALKNRDTVEIDTGVHFDSKTMLLSEK